MAARAQPHQVRSLRRIFLEPDMQPQPAGRITEAIIRYMTESTASLRSRSTTLLQVHLLMARPLTMYPLKDHRHRLLLIEGCRPLRRASRVQETMVVTTQAGHLGSRVQDGERIRCRRRSLHTEETRPLAADTVLLGGQRLKE